MTMDKRFQIFVSSTYMDLRKERQAVMQAILELKHMPVGMEMFPAANELQWSLIKREIEQCDYYVLILGGRYGSLAPDGVGYTEKEYQYALEIGKPVIAFIHQDPQQLVQRRVEQTDAGRARYASFRSQVEKRLIRYWNTPQDLAKKVTSSLVQLFQNTPAVGWIRGDVMHSEPLRTMNEVVIHARRTLAEWSPEAPLKVLHLGLDLSVASDYVAEVLRASRSNHVDYRILVLPESPERLAGDAPAEARDWTTYVPASVRRVMRHVRSFVANHGEPHRVIQVSIRHYARTPMIHGLMLRGERQLSYLSICHFTPPKFDNFEWGEFSYRNIHAGASPSDRHLAVVGESCFEDLWRRASEPRWYFHAEGHQVLVDEETAPTQPEQTL